MTDSRKLALDANRRLAVALGWTNIVDVGNALLGRPAWACDNSRDQVKVPDWAGDWTWCGPLMAKYQIDIEQNRKSVIASHNCHRTLSRQMIADESERDQASRLMVVDAVCAKLEAGQ